MKPVVAIDFDGVLTDHSHSFAPGPIPDRPLTGALAWLEALAPVFQIVLHTARAEAQGGPEQIVEWMSRNGFGQIPVTITATKPPFALWYVDDRGWTFGGPGDYPSPEALLEAQPWWQAGRDDEELLPPLDASSAAAAVASLAARALEAEPEVTDALARIVSAAGGQLSGLEHRLKAESALAGKLAAVMQERDLTLEQAAADVKDALRYTAVFRTDDYTAGVRETLDLLDRSAGLTAWRTRNYWLPGAGSDRYVDGTYVGVNVVLRGADGYPLELQFHTPQSLDVQAINWDLYRLLRSGQAGGDADQIVADMRANNALVERPDGIASVEEFTVLSPVGGKARIPASAHYRPADPGSDRRCDTCSYYAAGTHFHCGMFDTEVEPGYVCDEWAEGLIAAVPTRPQPAPADVVARHNRLLALGNRRADELEQRLTDLLEPILAAAGRTAATRFEQLATDHLTAAAPTSLSTMVCLKPTVEQAEAIADPDGEPADTLHVTLAYLGEVEAPLDPIADALRTVAAQHGPLDGVVSGYGRFGEPANVGVLLPDVPGLVELRVDVTEALVAHEVWYSRDHGFEAHITVDKTPEDAVELAEMMSRAGAPLTFAELLIVRGDTEIVRLPLTGATALTATANPPWSSPAGDELVDVPALVSKLRTKTDPVRQAAVQAQMTPALKAAGIDFDATNPLTAKAFASSGAHIKSIADTTRLNVMRIVRESYDKGLSIPDTAAAIREGMTSSSRIRATMIARTELAGAVHAGSLAATRIVSDATGDKYTKKWMTAPGALHPRHEDYDGLDGQTQPLDGLFQVGDAQLEYPGDQNGPPEEVINCRCTMSYDSPSGEEEIDAESGPPDLMDAGDAEAAVGGEGEAMAEAPVFGTDYAGHLQRELYGLRNKTSGVNTQIKRGRDVERNQAKLLALQQRVAEIKALAENPGTAEDELADVRRRLAGPEPTTLVEKETNELLRKREQALVEFLDTAKIEPPRPVPPPVAPPPPSPTAVAPPASVSLDRGPLIGEASPLLDDLVALRQKAEWITPHDAALKASPSLRARYFPSTEQHGTSVPVYVQEQMRVLIDAGKRVEQEMNIPARFDRDVQEAEERLRAVQLGTITQRMEARDAIRYAKDRRARRYRDELLRALGSVREIGPSGDARLRIVSGGTGVRKATKLLEQAQTMLPRSWLAETREIAAGTKSRGYHVAGSSTRPSQIYISDRRSPILTDLDGLAVAVHELGHEFEGNPLILAAEKAFYEYRTSARSFEASLQEDIKSLQSLVRGSGYGANEVARPDEFADPYMGKDYGGRNYELLSMGLEAVMNGTEELDAEMRQFIVGLLALI